MKSPAFVLLVLPAFLMGCPSDTEENNDGSPTGHVSGSSDTENEQAPAGQHEPQVPEDGEAPPSDGGATTADGDEATSDDASDSSADAEETDVAGDVTVQQLDWDGVLALVESHRGKVVVVDLWSLSCQPCLEEFPNLVALSQQYPDDVACISVSTDYQGLANRPLDYYEPRVLEFLEDKQATFENVLCTVPKFDLFEQIDINSEPTIIVFNQAGEEAQVFTGLQEDDSEISYERHIVPFVEGLLAAPQ